MDDTITRSRFSEPEWDLSGLPASINSDSALHGLEIAGLFLTHWQIAGYVGGVPSPLRLLTYSTRNGACAGTMAGCGSRIPSCHSTSDRKPTIFRN